MKDSPENPKIEKNSEIDLMNVKIEFWSDEQIAAFFDDRLEVLNDPENFLSKNQTKHGVGILKSILISNAFIVSDENIFSI